MVHVCSASLYQGCLGAYTSIYRPCPSSCCFVVLVFEWPVGTGNTYHLPACNKTLEQHEHIVLLWLKLSTWTLLFTTAQWDHGTGIGLLF